MANREGILFLGSPAAGTGFLLPTLFALSGVIGCGELAEGERQIPDDPPVVKKLKQDMPAWEVPPPPKAPTVAQPPPISGGTLLVTKDDTKLVAADPDRDSVWIADAKKGLLLARVRLMAGSEPGRLVEDQDGMIHVALRQGWQIATIDPAAGTLSALRNVCAGPRGLAYDAATDNLHVACTGGELVTLKARTGVVSRTLHLDRDLRDVVVKGDHLLISRFRSAEVLEIDAAGGLVGRAAPRKLTHTPQPPQTAMASSSPSTAWRMVGLPSGTALMLHQRSHDRTVVLTQRASWGNPTPCPCPCTNGTTVSTGVTVFSGSASPAEVGGGAYLPSLALMVDVAVTRDGGKLALIGASPLRAISGWPVTVLDSTYLTSADACLPGSGAYFPSTKSAELIAGSFDSSNQLWVQSRHPAQLLRLSRTGEPMTIALDGAEDRSNAGHRLFHTVTDGLVACASCHAEAGDDAHVWTFDPIGPRRTQSLRGGILASAPFHWDGDMTDINKLMRDVFTGRMSGRSATHEQIQSLGAWLDAQPALPKSPPRDPSAVARGRALFENPVVGCKSCHDGALYTNNLSIDVGTGKPFQVPALRDIAERAPYLHDGCAKTLRARFDPDCGGGDRHGKTSHLSSTEIDELVAYLETL